MFPANQLEKDIKIFHAEFNNSVNEDSPQVSQISHIVNYVLSTQGKFIRPQLLLSFCSLFGCIDKNRFKLAVAVEYIHTASLIHDDIIDDAVKRRNKKPLHLEWDVKTAILIGDFLYSRAFEIIGQSSHHATVEIFAHAAKRLSMSEINELGSENDIGLLADSDRCINIMREKTAVLFGAACEAAAVISSGESYRQQALQFGMNIGMAFQLCDDALDYKINDDGKWGKEVMQDLSKGKITLPLVYAYEEMNKTQQERTREVIKNSKPADEGTDEVGEIGEIVRSGNSLKRIQHLAAEFATKARNNLHTMPHNSVSESLEYLTHSIVNRVY